MPRGIIFFGGMGVGDTTLGKKTASILGYPHFDIDDYIWRWDTEIPYELMRPKEEKISLLTNAIANHSHFVMSGSMWSFRKAFENLFDLAVFMTAPAEIRAERIRSRSIKRWGNRVLPGGDMYNSSNVYRDYLACAQNYDHGSIDEYSLAQHEKWAEELPCPVLRIDGTKTIEENALAVVEYYRSLFFP